MLLNTATMLNYAHICLATITLNLPRPSGEVSRRWSHCTAACGGLRVACILCHSSYHWITRWCRKLQNLQLRSLHWPSACIMLRKTHMPFSLCTNPLYLFVHPFLWKYLCMLLICTAKNEILYELYSSAVSIQSHKAVLTVNNKRGLVNWAFRMQLDNVNNITPKVSCKVFTLSEKLS